MALNPIFFVMSGTFMSDVPALSLSLIALAVYTRALRNGRLVDLAAGMVFATLATITRQNANVTPLVATVLLWRQRTLRRHAAWHIGVLLPLAAGVCMHIWFSVRPDGVRLAPIIPSAARVFIRCLRSGIYPSLTVLPLLGLRPGIVSGDRFLAALLGMLYGAGILLLGRSLLDPPHAYQGGSSLIFRIR